MNLYLAVFTNGNLQVVTKKIIRHTHGEKAAKFLYDELRQCGYVPEPQDIEVTLLVSEGPIEIIEDL